MKAAQRQERATPEPRIRSLNVILEGIEMKH
jgi:hypothetical protein